MENFTIGFKPPNRNFKITPEFMELTIICSKCGDRHNYNVTEKNEIEVLPCPHCEKELDKRWLEELPDIIKEMNKLSKIHKNIMGRK